MDTRDGVSQTGGELQPRQEKRVRGKEIIQRAEELRRIEREIHVELERLRGLIKGGKGDYGKRFYVRDDLWENWLFAELILTNILRRAEKDGKK